jgi:hypothetical protein
VGAHFPSLAVALAAGLGVAFSRDDVRSVVEIKKKRRHTGVVDDAMNGDKLIELLAEKGVTVAAARALFTAAYVAPAAHLAGALRRIREAQPRAGAAPAPAPVAGAVAAAAPAVAAPAVRRAPRSRFLARPRARAPAVFAAAALSMSPSLQQDDDDDNMQAMSCAVGAVAARAADAARDEEASSAAPLHAAAAAALRAAADASYEACVQEMLLASLAHDKETDADVGAFWARNAPTVQLLWREELPAGEAAPLCVTQAWCANDPRCAAFLAAYGAAAGQPLLLRGFRARLPCGAEAAVACGELRGGAYTFSFLDTRPLPDALNAPPGALGALAAALTAAAFAAAAAIDGAVLASLASAAPGRYFVNGGWLVREPYMCFGRVDSRARTRLAPGTTRAAAAAIAAAMQAAANARLVASVYPRAFALAAQLGVVRSARTLRPGGGDGDGGGAMPVHPGCHFTKTALKLLTGAEDMLPGDASLGDAALRLLSDAGNACMVLRLAAPQPETEAYAKAVAARITAAACVLRAAAGEAAQEKQPAPLAMHFAARLRAALAAAPPPAVAAAAALARGAPAWEVAGTLRCGADATTALRHELEALQKREQAAAARRGGAAA